MARSSQREKSSFLLSVLVLSKSHRKTHTTRSTVYRTVDNTFCLFALNEIVLRSHISARICFILIIIIIVITRCSVTIYCFCPFFHSLLFRFSNGNFATRRYALFDGIRVYMGRERVWRRTTTHAKSKKWQSMLLFFFSLLHFVFVSFCVTGFANRSSHSPRTVRKDILFFSFSLVIHFLLVGVTICFVAAATFFALQSIFHSGNSFVRLKFISAFIFLFSVVELCREPKVEKPTVKTANE